METITNIMEMASIYGFPAIACCIMGWFFKYVFDKNREDVNNINQSHAQEMESVKDALNNNTLVIQRLVDFLQNKEGFRNDE
jgi:hypothetical protein